MSDSQTLFVGLPIDRVEGKLKVTGQARYSADMPFFHLAHAVVIESTVTRGRIRRIDASAARRLPGVIGVFTHQSGLRLKSPRAEPKGGGKSGNGNWMPLQDAVVHFNGQHIGLVVAESLEAAMQAASLVKVSYAEAAQSVDMSRNEKEVTEPDTFFGQKVKFRSGDSEVAAREPGIIALRETYSTPVENHNPIEPHATVAAWKDDKLTIYDATQGVSGTRTMLAQILGIPEANIRVVSYFLGGGFGCKGFFWPHTALAAAVARKLRRPVKLVLTRQQMFSMNGNRSATRQEILLASDPQGTLKAVKHVATTQTSRLTAFVEPCVLATKMLYRTPNIEVIQRLIPVDSGSPCPMRAPGEATGSFAIESAMDELAYRLKMDPIQLRLKNYADRDLEKQKPFSSKKLKECYQKGADLFEWSRRAPDPRSMREGGYLIGLGMATAAYPANRVSASAKAELRVDGRAVVRSGTQDIGTGTYTIMSQIAADALGIAVESVRFELGDTDFPKAPVSAGSQTAASVGNAVAAACGAVRQQLLHLATGDARSPLHGIPAEQVLSQGGRFFVKGDSSKGESYSAILKRHQRTSLSVASGESSGMGGGPEIGWWEPDTRDFVFHSFGAQFAEVRVDTGTGEVRLSRMTGVYDFGTVLNAKTARSQCIGGMIWGAGMALMEQTVYDLKSGRVITRNLADYKVPVHADTPTMNVHFIDVPDREIGPVGARGTGELPICGMAAAIANAVFHATGRRIRDLPIVPEKLL